MDSVQESRIARQRLIHKITSYDSCFPQTFCLLSFLLGISKILLVHILNRCSSVKALNFLQINGYKMGCTSANF